MRFIKILISFFLFVGFLGVAYFYTQTMPFGSDKKVVHDGNFITSQGPGTAFDFAFYLTSVLCDKKIEEQVKAKLISS